MLRLHHEFQITVLYMANIVIPGFVISRFESSIVPEVILTDTATALVFSGFCSFLFLFQPFR